MISFKFVFSDVSSQDETPRNINYLRDIYTTNVTFVINELKMKKPNILIAIAGPIILGKSDIKCVFNFFTYSFLAGLYFSCVQIIVFCNSYI